ncbi:putative NF-kappa-B-repressing factor-like [Penaeus vannamei]|uniref:Putative NF-kappa-B-repressing factor-like n=1 Tax=Penaeus vannamei TaxID=6689 RepID=A0A3R7SVA4_PENVA|nr:putative NF-kappa-B-repressing factor-like [Penaeus vannamei]
MSFNTNWNVEAYHTFYESERKLGDFILAHKDRIPEERLICLAQVFVNVELLGCRYPEQTMKQVAVLAKDVANGYRERKKNKLQRTFVKASDAASAKVQGSRGPPK